MARIGFHGHWHPAALGQCGSKCASKGTLGEARVQLRIMARVRFYRHKHPALLRGSVVSNVLLKAPRGKARVQPRIIAMRWPESGFTDIGTQLLSQCGLKCASEGNLGEARVQPRIVARRWPESGFTDIGTQLFWSSVVYNVLRTTPSERPRCSSESWPESGFTDINTQPCSEAVWFQMCF